MNNQPSIISDIAEKLFIVDIETLPNYKGNKIDVWQGFVVPNVVYFPKTTCRSTKSS
jgi:hypothetical protein